MTLTAFHHQIFDAMPVGRPVTAADMRNRANIPPGWTDQEVSQALHSLGRAGGVLIDRNPIKGIPNFFTRNINRPNGVSK